MQWKKQKTKNHKRKEAIEPYKLVSTAEDTSCEGYG